MGKLFPLTVAADFYSHPSPEGMPSADFVLIKSIGTAQGDAFFILKNLQGIRVRIQGFIRVLY
jgi:hypothetical protein